MSAKNTGNHGCRVMKGGTDLDKLKQMMDGEIERAVENDPDTVLMEDFDWDEVRVRMPEKKGIFIRLDDDVIDWFKGQGKGYQARINVVLRSYMEAKVKL